LRKGLAFIYNRPERRSGSAPEGGNLFPEAIMGIWLEGKPVADRIRATVKEEVSRIQKRTGATPGLTGVLVGDSPASQSYLRMKEKACLSLGLRGRVLALPADASPGRLKALIEDLNADPSVDGILVQLPLPKGFDTQAAISWIDPAKDVDGIHPYNLGLLLQNSPGPRACTPLGCLELIAATGVPFEGRDAVVIGRSLIVGKPVAAMLTNANATVTICHSKTRDLARVCARADILIAAMGQPGFVTPEFVKEGAVVIDVGSNAVRDKDLVRRLFGDGDKRLAEIEERGYAWVGDVDPRAIDRAGWLTPSPGGVGPLTIAMLMRNTLEAFTRRRPGANPRMGG
jgi:methylenetetrahydrofolate dehydrogenase (NADP+)/methenyltetrahydrofolate cyclohydrolase